MSGWAEISDLQIAQDALPLADLFSALRSRDQANATKPLPWPHGTTQDSTTQFSWTTLLTYKIYVPEDVPSGFFLYLPVLCYVTMGAYQTEAYPGNLRLTLGSTNGEAGTCDWDAGDLLELCVQVETGLRGAVQSLILAGCVPENYGAGVGYKTTLTAGGPSDAYSALHSIRRS